MKALISKHWHLMLIGFVALSMGGFVLFYFQGERVVVSGQST
ncbi:hypothetical protein ABFT51_23260 [Paenibacillus peoriae]